MVVAVFKKGSSWVAQVYLGPDASGKKRYRSKSAQTKREAVTLESELRLQVARGDARPLAPKTLGDLLDRWLDTADLTEATRYNYRRMVEARVRPALGDIPLRRLSPERLDAFYARLRDPQDGSSPLAPNSVRNVHALLRHALNVGVQWGWLPTNPALRAASPRGRQIEIKAPSLDDLVMLLGVIERTDPDLHAVVFLAATTGVRRGELIGLRWRDVTLDGKPKITVRTAVVEVGGQIIETDPKTHQVREIALDQTTSDLLGGLKDRAMARASECGGVLAADAFVYSTGRIDGAAPTRPGVLSRRFKAALKVAGLEGVRLHDLRHAVATHLITGGTDVQTVAKRLGHADASVTLRVYSHLVREADQAAADSMGRMLGARSA